MRIKDELGGEWLLEVVKIEPSAVSETQGEGRRAAWQSCFDQRQRERFRLAKGDPLADWIAALACSPRT